MMFLSEKKSSQFYHSIFSAAIQRDLSSSWAIVLSLQDFSNQLKGQRKILKTQTQQLLRVGPHCLIFKKHLSLSPLLSLSLSLSQQACLTLIDSSDFGFKGNSPLSIPNEAQLLHNPHIWASLQQKHFLSQLSKSCKIWQGVLTSSLAGTSCFLLFTDQGCPQLPSCPASEFLGQVVSHWPSFILFLQHKRYKT